MHALAAIIADHSIARSGAPINLAYTRSWEGSAVVFLTSLLVMLFFRDAFTARQFSTALAAMPFAMTLVEARAPHTRDTPFLFAVGGVPCTRGHHLALARAAPSDPRPS